MKSWRLAPLFPLAMAFAIGCSDDDSSNPATVGKNELNPPRGLVTVTGDKQIELRWSTGNAEEGFKGYDVFVYKGKLQSVIDAKPAYPANANLANGSIPRCVDNNAVFKLFGFAKDSTTSCKGDTATDAKTSILGLADDTTVEKLSNFVKCYDAAGKELGNANISMLVSGTSLDEKSCIVKDLENGQTYTFFVSAIMGDDYQNMSWTSNFVEDTPALQLLTNGELTIKEGHYYRIDAASLTGLTAINAATLNAQNNTCEDQICKVNATNQKTDQGLYIGRLGSTDTKYPQRIFFSVPKGGTVEVKLRGPQTNDPLNKSDDKVANSIPGDAAINTTYETGVLYPVYGNQVFDLKVTKGTEVRYGKIIFKAPALTGTSATGDVKMKVTVVMQPAVNTFHYFQ